MLFEAEPLAEEKEKLIGQIARLVNACGMRALLDNFQISFLQNLCNQLGLEIRNTQNKIHLIECVVFQVGVDLIPKYKKGNSDNVPKKRRLHLNQGPKPKRAKKNTPKNLKKKKIIKDRAKKTRKKTRKKARKKTRKKARERKRERKGCKRYWN